VDFPIANGDPIRIGCLICMDREYPEAARVTMLAGAELILIPNACELEQHRLHQIEARAFENMVAIAVANYPAPQENGHSVAVSPIAFNDEGSAGMVLCEAGPESGIYLAHFDMDAIRAYRASEVWGPNYRHPGLYRPIVDE
jgi:N-carbamoylputrescine amidase